MEEGFVRFKTCQSPSKQPALLQPDRLDLHLAHGRNCILNKTEEFRSLSFDIFFFLLEGDSYFQMYLFDRDS